MSQTLDNGAIVPINSDAYNLTGDFATFGNSLDVVAVVANQSARDALTKFVGRAVTRNDVPGQPIEIWNGSSWQRQGPKVNANGQIAGSGMATNAFITGSLQPYIQGGSAVVTTDNSGNAGITYPAAFPNGVITVLCVGGDSNSGNFNMQPAGAFSQTNSIFYVNVKTANTGANLNAGTVRVNWIAVGW